MPKSGSYWYPGVQTPNSSYPSVDVRELSSAPSTGNGVGKIYALSTDKDLYFKDSEGNEIAIASAGSGSSNVFGDVYVSGTLYTSGSIFSPNGSLTLSSSNGNTVLSGNLYILPHGGVSPARIIFPFAGAANILHGASPTNSFGFAAGEVNAYRKLQMHGVSLVGLTTHLVLSSSVDSIVAMSGALKHEKRNAATMPVGSDSLSGSVVWVDDTKTLAVYGPLGWTRILTGSVI